MMKHVFEPPRILIAGIGNVSLGDDGFGVAVSEALSKEDLPSSVRVANFGLRQFDLPMPCNADTTPQFLSTPTRKAAARRNLGD